jgi:hypothetical protein
VERVPYSEREKEGGPWFWSVGGVVIGDPGEMADL